MIGTSTTSLSRLLWLSWSLMVMAAGGLTVHTNDCVAVNPEARLVVREPARSERPSRPHRRLLLV